MGHVSTIVVGAAAHIAATGRLPVPATGSGEVGLALPGVRPVAVPAAAHPAEEPEKQQQQQP